MSGAMNEAASGAGARLLNLGCGGRFHPGWVNVDFQSTGEGVIACDLDKGVPFPDDSFDVVYHSHLLEHFPKRRAPVFLAECFRVLKPGGIVRVAVPDLEGAARTYVELLDKAAAGDEEAGRRYEWMVIELLDQLVRNVPGGEMVRHWLRNPVPAQDFVSARVGSEFENFRRRVPPGYVLPADDGPVRLDPAAVGRFRLSGEIHQWMYDRYSLGRLLAEAGFEGVAQRGADESDIPGFNGYLLDIEPDGRTRKPDSLFMEARKPARTLRFNSAVRRGSGRPLKVVHLATTETGGAGIAAARLHRTLRDEGVDSRMVALQKRSNDPSVSVVPMPDGSPLYINEKGDRISPLWPAAQMSWREMLDRYPGRPRGQEMFSGPRGMARLEWIEELRDADVVNLHWVAGMADFPSDRVLAGLPVVWTLHDMNPFTGGCHYDAGCGRWRERCGACPQLGSSTEKDDSRLSWLLKSEGYSRLDLTCVTPSRWLGECVGQSGLMGGRDRRVIPNGLPEDVFRPLDRRAVRASLGVGPDEVVFVFGAEAVGNTRKGLSYLLKALRDLAATKPDQPVTLGVFGMAPELKFSEMGFRVLEFGFVSEPQSLAAIYSMADAFVLPSLQDNLPNVLLEAMACGLPVVGFDIGGVPDVVEHRVNGYLAAEGDVKGLTDGMRWIMAKREDKAMRRACRRLALERYTLRRQAREYLDLYRSILERRGRDASIGAA